MGDGPGAGGISSVGDSGDGAGGVAVVGETMGCDV